ncbi:MAG: hypothetical protein ACM3O3_00595 [Syntrophothermus sp.]
MFEKEIKFISDYSLNKVRNEGQSITFEKLSKLELHPAILQFISSELDYLITDDRKRLLQRSLFDYSGSAISNYFNLISQEIKKTKKVPVEDIMKLIMQATSFNANYVCRPRWTLMKLIFNDAESKNIDEIKQLLNYSYYYDYLKDILNDVLDKVNSFTISSKDFENLIKKIDQELFSIKGNDFIENAIDSIADFYNEGESSKNKIPFVCLEAFLREKFLTDYITKIKELLPVEVKPRFTIDEFKDALVSISLTFRGTSTEIENEAQSYDEMLIDTEMEGGIEEIYEPEPLIESELLTEPETIVEPEPEIIKEPEVPEVPEVKEEPVIVPEVKEEPAIVPEVKQEEVIIPEPEPEMKSQEIKSEPIKAEEIKPVQIDEEEKLEPVKEEEKLEPISLPVKEEKEIPKAPEIKVEPIKEEIKPDEIIESIKEELKPQPIIEETKPVTVKEEIKKEIPKISEEKVEPVKEEIKPEPIKEEVKPEPIKVEVKPQVPKAPEKKPEVPKEPEIKRPEPPKQPEIKKPEPKKEPEIKKQEPPKSEIKKPEPQKPQEVRRQEPTKVQEVRRPEPPKPPVKTSVKQPVKRERKIDKDFPLGYDFTLRMRSEPEKFSINFGPKKSEEDFNYEEEWVEGKVPSKQREDSIEKDNLSFSKAENEKYEDLLDNFSKKDIKKIISSIFNEDDKDFYDTMRKISQCENYESCTEILKEVYQTYKVNPYSSEGIKLTNGVANFFNQG